MEEALVCIEMYAKMRALLSNTGHFLACIRTAYLEKSDASISFMLSISKVGS